MNNYIVRLEEISPIYEEHVNKMGDIQFVTEKVLRNKQIQNGDTYFVPTGLSEMSPLSYQGVELALKLYFNIVSKQYERCKVVLLGNEERATFFELCRYAKFLHCPNVWYIDNSKEAVEGFLKEQHESQINHDKAIRALQEIGIKQPASYKSHHSITNQWSVSRWSNCYGFETVVDEQIRKSLYFNYLKCIYALPEEFQHKNLPVFTKGKILVIDDELSKGWHSFFENLFQKRAKNEVEYQELGLDFSKIKDRDEIVNVSVAKILDFKPDVVLLDLRLHDDDFGDQYEKFTSIQILEKLNSLEEYNRGTQIIGFTASNKVWNYLKWSKAGIDDFILKESPENSKDQNFTQVSLANLESKIKRAFEKASFLKDIHSRICTLKKQIKINTEQEEFQRLSFRNLDMAFSQLKGYKDNSDNLDYSFMHLFYVIEDLVNPDKNDWIECNENFYSVDGNDFYDGEKSLLQYQKSGYYTRSSGRGVSQTIRSLDLNLKIAAVLIFHCELPDSNRWKWHEIRDARNKLVHSNEHVPETIVRDTVSFLSNIIR